MKTLENIIQLVVFFTFLNYENTLSVPDFNNFLFMQ